MDYIRGEPLQRAWKNLSSAQRANVLNKLSDFVAQLRSIPQPLPSPSSSLHSWAEKRVSGHNWIGSTLGRQFLDFSMSTSETSFGPFANEQEFYDARVERFTMMFGDHAGTMAKLEDIRRRMRLRGDLPIVFTHGDINRRNILVHVHGPNPEDVEITALLDWEQAGWRPIYWESWKWLFVSPHTPQWTDFGVKEIGKGYDNAVDLETELQLLSGYIPC